MSWITENTIVIKPIAEQDLLDDFKATEEEYRISDFKCVFRNENYVVYIFDCNYDPPWLCLSELKLECNNIVSMETHYGDCRLTQKYEGKRGMVETNYWLKTIMKRKLTQQEYELLEKRIAYSW